MLPPLFQCHCVELKRFWQFFAIIIESDVASGAEIGKIAIRLRYAVERQSIGLPPNHAARS
jgi:RNA polymerase subunit RPABC4/transcription elongation factor Spt4